MRVIGGTLRSRPLLSPRGTDTRPTSDRLRETLFNILAPRMEGARFADLYAGCGAVGIEAISRGAVHVAFSENGKAALEALRGNLRALKIVSGYTLEAGGVATSMKRGGPWDVVFLDPPYAAAEEYERTLLALGSGVHLAEGAVVVAEHASRSPLVEQYGRLRQMRTVRQGDASLTFFAVEDFLEGVSQGS